MRGRVVLAAVAVLTFGAEPAIAAFPGTNGKIYFARDVAGDGPANYDIFSMNADGTGATNLSKHPESEFNPAVSADGQRVAFTRSIDGGQSDIILMNADGTGAQNLTQSAESEEQPRFSPDGTRIVFEREQDIWIMSVSGGPPTNLTATATPQESGPEFSPNGATIAYSRSEGPAGQTDLWTIPADGSTTGTPLTSMTSTYEARPSYAPDGSRIAFFGTSATSDIHVIPATGGTATNLTDNAAEEGSPVFSPDGTRIVFFRAIASPAGFDIVTMNAAGTLQTNITNSPEVELHPYWAPVPTAVSDTTAPETKITKKPKKRTTKRKAKFGFKSSEAGSTFQCKLDRKKFKTCSSPYKKKVKVGKHKFKVRAIDAAGNVDPKPAKFKWRVLER